MGKGTSSRGHWGTELSLRGVDDRLAFQEIRVGPKELSLSFAKVLHKFLLTATGFWVTVKLDSMSWCVT